MKSASPHSAVRKAGPAIHPVAATASSDEATPRANAVGTVLCLVGLGITGITFSGSSANDMASYAAIGVGLSLLISAVADARTGWQNLARVDLMAVFALYFLTFVEYLFKQEGLLTFGTKVTQNGITVCLLGFAGLVVGRHFVSARRHPFAELCRRPAPSAVLYFIFWSSFVLGFFYMLLSVKFDFYKLIDNFLEPRFAQPWSRGRLGGWKEMMVEIAAVVNLVPPLGGIMLARRHDHSRVNVFLVGAAVLFTFFYGFTTGTRNLFAGFLVTFLIGYCLGADLRRQRRELIAIGVTIVMVLFVSTKLMLDFRTIGLKEYVKQGYYSQWDRITKEESFSVDNNLNAICGIVSYFPKSHKYLGWEVPYISLIHPIPRALWAKKPEGMSVSVEEILGAQGWTISTTFLGEAYMMGGPLAVFGMSSVLAALFSWWNLLASRRNSEFGMLIYASGFAAAVISMRSMQWLSTTILPTIGGVVAGHLLLKGGAKVVAKIRDRSRGPASFGQHTPARRPNGTDLKQPRKIIAAPRNERSLGR